jgi:hypothetical protein
LGIESFLLQTLINSLIIKGKKIMTKKEIKKYAKENNCSIREAQRQLGVKATGNCNVMSETRKKVNTIKLSEIKTPSNVSEFRENLKTYFAGYSQDELSVQTIHNAEPFGIKYELINSLQDIIEITGDYNPSLIPLINFDMDEVFDHMIRTNQSYSSNGFFHDNYEVYKNAPGILMKIKKSTWVTLDNQILREFFIKVLGEY